ncbi:MAG: papain-like cysteine protease family protein [Pyrinomonadaceae bacterium]
MFKVTPAVKPLNQARGTTCWLACLEMMFEWKKDKGDATKDKTKICDLIDQKTDYFSSIMVEKGLGTHECAPVARALGLQPTGAGDYTRDILYSLVSNKGPLFVAGIWIENCPHAVVVTACDKDSDNIKIINPWRNYDLSESPRTVNWLNARGDLWKKVEGSVMYWKN